MRPEAPPVSGAADIVVTRRRRTRAALQQRRDAEVSRTSRRCSRQSGRTAANAVILPMSKTAEWWEKSALERHSYFYPHHEDASGSPVKGHARAAEAGITRVFRRLYHNPDGYMRPNEFDFITYFECTDENLTVFDEMCRALRDQRQNPEWKYVLEGPEWRGRRVFRW